MICNTPLSGLSCMSLRRESSVKVTFSTMLTNIITMKTM